jgi:hypothetical protein
MIGAGTARSRICLAVVAQSGTLTYRRLVIGRPSASLKARESMDAQQDAILRNGRLTICATLNEYAVPTPPRTGLHE